MSGLRSRGETIRRFILQQIVKHPGDITQLTARKFGISRQAVNVHLRKLVDEKALTVRGMTRNRTYHLHALIETRHTYKLSQDLAEDVVWRRDAQPDLGAMPSNVIDIWRHGFTEMFNNAIDHSEGTEIHVHLRRTAVSTELALYDNGVGIFKKIQRELGLLDERHAVLELAKGKLTTDPENHSGEGIFFTSRIFDEFQILSGSTFFSHTFSEKEDWILERDRSSSGTGVWMNLNNHTSRTIRKIFDQYSGDGDFGFTKTVVPVKLMKYGDDKLVSRSQAKRLLASVDKFKTVVLDFKEVDHIGQAFADEVFRVFIHRHPNMELVPINVNKSIKQMIKRVQSSL